MKFLIEKLFQQIPSTDGAEDREHALQVATAALLLEVVRADFEIAGSEMARLRDLLKERFELSSQELERLIDDATIEADQMISLQHLTRLMNEQLDEDDKKRVIEMMWELVFADGELDHFEEHLIRQVAELLYLPHSVFIQARHKAESGLSS